MNISPHHSEGIEKQKMNAIHNKDSKSLVLEAVIIEPILISCIHKVSFSVLALSIQKIMPISFSDLKKYLFYLIDFGLVSYNGLQQIFTIEDGGLGLLDMIDKEKRQEYMNLKDITITFECTLYAQRN